MIESPAPFSPEPPATGGLDQYLLHGRKEIRHLLLQLIGRHALINAYPALGSHAFLTALIVISDADDALYLDSSPDPATNRHIAAAGQLTCVTQLDRIRVQFLLTGLQPAEYEGREVFCARLPDSVLRLQRRESYRLSIPSSDHASCRFEPSRQIARGGLDCRIVDLSATGVAVDIPPGIRTGFVIGEEVGPCTLDLPGVAPITCILQVRNVSQRQPRAGIRVLRVGFRFVDLPRGVDAQIQRFIFKVERETNARKLGDL